MSQFAEDRRSALDQVKADAEALTKARLLGENPELETLAAERRDRYAEDRGEKAPGKKPEVSQPLPGQSDGSPDQGAIEEPSKKGKGNK